MQRQDKPRPDPDPSVRRLVPITEGQQELESAIFACEVVFALGPAGTGKTALAISAAAFAFDQGDVDRIVLARPTVDAGEQLGFLPGDLREKMAPWLRPLYDELGDRLGARRLQRCIADGSIEIAPIGFMRGRTIKNAFVVIDEAQNCTWAQLKMILTRLGDGSRMVLTGDPNQSDLPDGESGLMAMASKLAEVVPVVRLCQADVVRHPLVAEMLEVIEA